MSTRIYTAHHEGHLYKLPRPRDVVDYNDNDDGDKFLESTFLLCTREADFDTSVPLCSAALLSERRGTVVGLVSSGNAAVLFDEPGVGWHDHHVQLQLATSQLLQVPDRVPHAHVQPANSNSRSSRGKYTL